MSAVISLRMRPFGVAGELDSLGNGEPPLYAPERGHTPIRHLGRMQLPESFDEIQHSLVESCWGFYRCGVSCWQYLQDSVTHGFHHRFTHAHVHKAIDAPGD
jgi:hypothetical protein